MCDGVYVNKKGLYCVVNIVIVRIKLHGVVGGTGVVERRLVWNKNEKFVCSCAVGARKARSQADTCVKKKNRGGKQGRAEEIRLCVQAKEGGSGR